ncbi:hypothetical protein E2562_010668 [Oryza meyeriana var. granulata]|uniref:Uncharacterized protein n=1 Tax=Oryza meyeriana var. granulata TaxID=110450 RepID=A0A6G1EVY1_9ORYZ|nr:hypothetical protein E2562_010668 [Oryza meyeriana var. granulata]
MGGDVLLGSTHVAQGHVVSFAIEEIGRVNKVGKTAPWTCHHVSPYRRLPRRCSSRALISGRYISLLASGGGRLAASIDPGTPASPPSGRWRSDAGAGEEAEELLLRGAHGVDELAVHAVAEARGHVEREQRSGQAVADGDHHARAAVAERAETFSTRAASARARTQSGPYGTVLMFWRRPPERSENASARRTSSSKATAPSRTTVVGTSPRRTPRRRRTASRLFAAAFHGHLLSCGCLTTQSTVITKLAK